MGVIKNVEISRMKPLIYTRYTKLLGLHFYVCNRRPIHILNCIAYQLLHNNDPFQMFTCFSGLLVLKSKQRCICVYIYTYIIVVINTFEHRGLTFLVCSSLKQTTKKQNRSR